MRLNLKMSEITHPSQLPAVDKLLQNPAMPALRQSYGQEACTQAVRDVLAASITDATRFVVEGKGEADPIGDNAADDGRALNRRVEIMIKREETLQ